MRITEEQLIFLKELIRLTAKEAKVYIFGSRIDDNKQGGDIDVLILTNKLLNFEQKAGIKIAFMGKFGDQKLDLVNYTLETKLLINIF